ncbi:hypothetical protein M434DRAFT_400257 [Hypoxylon sp. CO27-5]|nr:hypothetical protein M434DRAFT_400257 [Hypoxylon sp. CO27-5]
MAYQLAEWLQYRQYSRSPRTLATTSLGWASNPTLSNLHPTKRAELESRFDGIAYDNPITSCR